MIRLSSVLDDGGFILQDSPVFQLLEYLVGMSCPVEFDLVGAVNLHAFAAVIAVKEDLESRCFY
jgi:hypothetical protein